jgi:hypothetical protein
VAAGGDLAANPYIAILALGGWAASHRSYVEGRIVLAGHDPSTIQFRHVLSLTTALVIEVYQELGMKFDEAFADLEGKLVDSANGEVPKKRAPPPPDDRASMAMLQSAMSGSSFKGPRS